MESVSWEQMAVAAVLVLIVLTAKTHFGLMEERREQNRSVAID